jgi:homoserine kinase type II
MAVFTEVSDAEARALLRRLKLGELTELRGIAGGIENTNYFATTDKAAYVLTLFERLNAQQLPFYLELMRHLAERGVPCPNPQADARGQLVHTVANKPAAVVNRLQGASVLEPEVAHCVLVGDMLARMHLAGQDFMHRQPNLRGLAWWNETVPLVRPHLSPEQRVRIDAELAYQNHVVTQAGWRSLPSGPIHADLFRDNVLFTHGAAAADDASPGELALGGFFDFYFAGTDTWVFDLSVCLNDWCIDWATGVTHEPRTHAMLQAYQAVRPLTAQERLFLPAALRAGALRFWISRLWDWHLPRQASLLTPHDPRHFERVLSHRVEHAAWARHWLSA